MGHVIKKDPCISRGQSPNGEPHNKFSLVIVIQFVKDDDGVGDSFSCFDGPPYRATVQALAPPSDRVLLRHYSTLGHNTAVPLTIVVAVSAVDHVSPLARIAARSQWSVVLYGRRFAVLERPIHPPFKPENPR